MHHENPATSEGGFTTLMLQTDNPEAYINTLKSNDSAFKATGTAAAGYCLTKIGNNTPGDMFIWSGFPTLADALASSTKYDPMQSPDSAFSDLRVAKYSVVWKPLMPFKLAPGFERMIRVVVPQADRMEFVSQMSQAQQGLYDAGYKMNLGVFEPIGGGAVEANIIQVRAIAATPSEFGKILDDFYAGSVDMGGDHWVAAMSGALQPLEAGKRQQVEIIDAQPFVLKKSFDAKPNCTRVYGFCADNSCHQLACDHPVWNC